MQRRDLLQAALAACAAPAVVGSLRAAGAPLFALGVASGSPRPDGMVLWTRLLGDGLAEPLPERVPVRWELADDEGFTRIAARGQAPAEAAWAHSVHAEPAGLAPGRWYFYRFEALGQRSAVGRTRTAPAVDELRPRLQFSIASCQRWDQGHYSAWRDVAAGDPDLVLFLGDYIYEYATGRASIRAHRGGLVTTLPQYRDRYAQYKSDPALQAAHAACPWLVIADDHEVANDYAGLQGAHLQPGFAEQRAAAYQAWWEHMPLPSALRPEPGAPGLRMHGRLDWGALARIHLLDARQHRSPQACPLPGQGGSRQLASADCPELQHPARSLLGAEQERWLAEGWSLEQPWNLLAQQTLMAPWQREDPARRGGRVWTDGWDGYPAARARLLAPLAERKLPGVVVLGGDVHANVVADLHADPADPASPVIASEFCGTSISSDGGTAARIDSTRRWNPHFHYARCDERGHMRFRLERGRLTAELRVVDDVLVRDSSSRTRARFVVEAGRPGPQLA